MLRSIIRGESVDQRAAAHGQLLLIKRVEALPPLLSYVHQPYVFQALEMMAHCGLLYFAAKQVHQIIDTEPYAAQLQAYFLARVVAQRLGKVNEINAHALTMIDDSLRVKSNRRQMSGISLLQFTPTGALVKTVLCGGEPLRHKQGGQRQHDQDESGPNRSANVALENAIDQQRHCLCPAL